MAIDSPQSPIFYYRSHYGQEASSPIDPMVPLRYSSRKVDPLFYPYAGRVLWRLGLSDQGTCKVSVPDLQNLLKFRSQ
ncbi:MAG: hypothetical protein V3U07_00755, partial [Nitrospirales bacterium]